jgi:Protein of unknown function (DUF4058)
MRPPFPGMDPWLEDPELWPDVHKSLVISIRDALAPMLRPSYFVQVESRKIELTGQDLDELYRDDGSLRTHDLPGSMPNPGGSLAEPMASLPYRVVVRLVKDEIEECFLTIQKLPKRNSVTVIEVLSTTIKATNDARRDYLAKQRDLMRSSVNLVEIDLLRAGQRMSLGHVLPQTDYRVVVSRPRPRKVAEVFGFNYRDAIPSISIPLSTGESEPSLDLNDILHALYERAGYDLSIDYCQPPHSPLRKEDRAWAGSILAQGEATP